MYVVRDALSAVIVGPDPVIHPPPKQMDTRVKPAYDT
jgi:hypothetical protein